MAASLGSNFASRVAINHAIGTSGSRSPTSLNVAYVHATSGTGIGVRYVCPTADTIDELYVFMDVASGTLGNITMACDIYNEHATTATQAGTTLRDSSTTTTMPNAADKWVKFAFATPYTPAIGEVLWMVIYNTAADPTTDFPQILFNTNMLFNTNVVGTGRFAAYTTTAGFSTAGTGGGEMPFVVKQGSNYFGQPYTQVHTTPYTSNTLKRGIVVDGVVASLILSGATFSTGSTVYSGLSLFDSSTGPGGSALSTYALGSDANESRDEIIGHKAFETRPTLTGGSDYKFVLTFGSASQLPNVLQIEDYASHTAVFDALTDGFNVCHGCIDDGASGWTIDKSISPCIALHIGEFVAAVSPIIINRKTVR